MTASGFILALIFITQDGDSTISSVSGFENASACLAAADVFNEFSPDVVVPICLPTSMSEKDLEQMEEELQEMHEKREALKKQKHKTFEKT